MWNFTSRFFKEVLTGIEVILESKKYFRAKLQKRDIVSYVKKNV